MKRDLFAPSTPIVSRDVTRRQFLSTAGALSAAAAVLPFGAIRQAEAQTAQFDYFIGPNGSNDNPGTATQPWAMTALASKPEIAGRRIGLLGGLYRLPSANAQDSGFIQSVRYGGFGESQRTVVQSVVPRLAVITTEQANGTYPQATAFALDVAGDYITLKDITLKGFSFTAIRVGGNDVLIEGCDIGDVSLYRYASYANKGDNVGGVTTDDGSNARNLTIRNCVIHDIVNESRRNSCIGNLYDSGHTLTVEYCTFFNAGGACYAKNRTGSITFRFNLVHGCDAGLATPWAVNGTKFSGSVINYHNNLILCPANHGGTGYQSTQVIVQTWNYYNNTFVQTGNDSTGCTYLPIESPRDPSCRLNHYNNIYHANGFSGSGMFVRTSESGTYGNIFATSDYNVFSPMRGPTSTIAGWQSLVPGRDLNSTVTAPTFSAGIGVDPMSYRLAAGSAGKGAGRAGGIPTGAATDVGCWGGGATRIGCSFGPVPNAPSIIQIS